MWTLRCAIEQVADWYPRLFLEGHVAACVAILSRYSGPPALLDVECRNVVSRRLGRRGMFQLEIDWSQETAERADRLRRTIQAKPLVEMAATALAFVLARRVIGLRSLDVTRYGGRADYYSPRVARALEVSGTEIRSELGRRHREKVSQALENPLRWDSYVVVCAFSDAGHRIRFSFHRAGEKSNA